MKMRALEERMEEEFMRGWKGGYEDGRSWARSLAKRLAVVRVLAFVGFILAVTEPGRVTYQQAGVLLMFGWSLLALMI
jgi:hypothetical protein